MIVVEASLTAFLEAIDREIPLSIKRWIDPDTGFNHDYMTKFITVGICASAMGHSRDKEFVCQFEHALREVKTYTQYCVDVIARFEAEEWILHPHMRARLIELLAARHPRIEEVDSLVGQLMDLTNRSAFERSDLQACASLIERIDSIVRGTCGSVWNFTVVE